MESGGMGKTVNSTCKANAQGEHQRQNTVLENLSLAKYIASSEPNRSYSVEEKWCWENGEGFIRKKSALKWDPRKEYPWRLMYHVPKVSEDLNEVNC